MIDIYVTDNQLKILAHRLENPSAITDVLEATYGYRRHDVMNACNLMYHRLHNHTRLIVTESLTPLQKHILADCIEGCTLVDMDKTMSRVFNTLKNKLIEAGIIE